MEILLSTGAKATLNTFISHGSYKAYQEKVLAATVGSDGKATVGTASVSSANAALDALAVTMVKTYTLTDGTTPEFNQAVLDSLSQKDAELILEAVRILLFPKKETGEGPKA